MSQKIQWIEEELQNLTDSGLYNRIRTLSSPQGAWLVVDGKRVLTSAPTTTWGWPTIPAWSAQSRKRCRNTASGRPRCAALPARWTCTSSWNGA